MMKTREIEFWCEPDDIKNLNMTKDCMLRLYVKRDQVSKNGQMVKLIQQIPEKRVEITESQFDEIVNNIGSFYAAYTLREGSILNAIRAKLFKNSDFDEVNAER